MQNHPRTESEWRRTYAARKQGALVSAPPVYTEGSPLNSCSLWRAYFYFQAQVPFQRLSWVQGWSPPGFHR
jgi:hypothetical protein